MRTVIFVTIAVLCCYTAFSQATIDATGGACTPTANPFGTTRCTATKKYQSTTPGTGGGAATVVDLAGCGCTTVATTGSYTKQKSTTFDPTGASNDVICSPSCLVDTASSTKQCDDTGLLCVACATNYAANGKTPSATAQASCGCVTANSVTACSTCGHGYYGTDSSSVAVVPSDSTLGATAETAYLSYVGATTLPTKCVACPPTTTLTNCAQCASATTCARCTTASGNTPDSNGSCSASKIIASIAFAFVGLVALLF